MGPLSLPTIASKGHMGALMKHSHEPLVMKDRENFPKWQSGVGGPTPAPGEEERPLEESVERFTTHTKRVKRKVYLKRCKTPQTGCGPFTEAESERTVRVQGIQFIYHSLITMRYSLKDWKGWITSSWTLHRLSTPLMTLGHQMGKSGWVNDPQRKHKGHLWERVKLIMEAL